MSSPYVTRSQWGARPSEGGNSLTGKGKGYALHWEGPEMGSRPHSECDNLMRSIQDYHMDGQGWSDIAYNLAVCEHGYIFEGRGKGKGSGANGTSDANHNYPSICALVGQNDDQPAELDRAIADAVALLRSWGVGSGQKGHRDFVSTECPGDELYNKIKADRYSGGGTPGDEDEMGDVNITGMDAGVAQVIAKAVWERYAPGGKNLATWLGEIGQDVQYLTEAVGDLAAATGTQLAAPPPPIEDAGGPSDE